MPFWLTSLMNDSDDIDSRQPAPPKPYGVRFRELRERAGLSRDKLARAIGMRGGSSIQRYEDPREFLDQGIPHNIIEKAVPVLRGQGNPPISDEELYSLTGIRFLANSLRHPTGDPRAWQPAHENLGEGSDVMPLFAEPKDLVGAKDIPVYASAQGGPDGELIVKPEPVEWVKRPEPLAKVPKAFAVFVTGDSMSPRFEPGDILLIHPSRPPSNGRDVLLTRTDEGSTTHALVKHLVRSTAASWIVREYNPVRRDFELSKSAWNQAFLVVGIYMAR